MLCGRLSGELLLGLWLLVACTPDPVPRAEELRVISLSPSISGVLVALGVGDALVGSDRFSRRLPGLEEVPSLGGLFAPDLERTIELRPTLVLGVGSEQQRSFFEQLRARGVSVHEFDPHTLPEVLASFRQIGELVGRESEGAALVASIVGDLDVIAAATAAYTRKSVALVVNREPLYIVAGGSFVSELIRIAGGENVFGDLEAPYPQVALETLAERQPDVLIDTTYPRLDDDSAARRYWSRFAWIGRVELIPTGLVTVPGAELASAARLIQTVLLAERTPSAAP